VDPGIGIPSPGVLALVPVDAGAGPAGSLEIALDPRGLFLVEDKDEDSVLPAPVIFLKYGKFSVADLYEP